jgi:hypothetical protein
MHQIDSIECAHGWLLFLDLESGKTPMPKLFLLDLNARITITSTNPKVRTKVKISKATKFE